MISYGGILLIVVGITNVIASFSYGNEYFFQKCDKRIYLFQGAYLILLGLILIIGKVRGE